VRKKEVNIKKRRVRMLQEHCKSRKLSASIGFLYVYRSIGVNDRQFFKSDRVTIFDIPVLVEIVALRLRSMIITWFAEEEESDVRVLLSSKMRISR